MADINVLNAVSGAVEDVVVINTELSNPIYRGPIGLTGPQGKSGVYVGETAPTDPDIKVWIKPTGTVDSTKQLITEAELEEALEDVEVDLSDYYTKSEVDNAISNALEGIANAEERVY